MSAVPGPALRVGKCTVSEERRGKCRCETRTRSGAAGRATAAGNGITQGVVASGELPHPNLLRCQRATPSTMNLRSRAFVISTHAEANDRTDYRILPCVRRESLMGGALCVDPGTGWAWARDATVSTHVSYSWPPSAISYSCVGGQPVSIVVERRARGIWSSERITGSLLFRNVRSLAAPARGRKRARRGSAAFWREQPDERGPRPRARFSSSRAAAICARYSRSMAVLDV